MIALPEVGVDHPMAPETEKLSLKKKFNNNASR